MTDPISLPSQTTALTSPTLTPKDGSPTTTQRSSELFARSLRVTPGGVHSPVRAFKGVGGVPRFIQSAKGSRLIDVDGNEYIDYCMAWGPLLYGHQDPEVADAVGQALNRGWSYGTAEPYSLELAELITSRIPWVEKIRFVNSGTEAVMAALRVARAATGRNLVLKFDGCYHGHVDSMLVRAGSGLAEMASPDSAGVSPTTASETLVAPLDDLAALERILAERGTQIAAIAVEPLPANNGLLIQRAGFLQRLRELCDQYGCLLLFDEVISGFRVALGGMAEVSGVRPDLVCYGKIIGGGFPVGAYGGRAELMDWVAPQGPVYQAGTLSANPVAMSAGLANLRKILRDPPYERIAARTERVALAIEAQGRALSAQYPEFPVVHVQREASLFWCVFGDHDGQRVRAPAQFSRHQKSAYASVFHALLAQGIYIAPSGYEVSFFSEAHSSSDEERLISAYASALKALATRTSDGHGGGLGGGSL